MRVVVCCIACFSFSRRAPAPLLLASAMAPKLAAGFDLLGEMSDEEEEEARPAPAAAAAVDYEALQRAGYKGGPSVLFMPEARAAGQTDWKWGHGQRGAAGEESAEARAALEHATGAGLQEAMEAQLKEAERARELREASYREELELRAAATGRGRGRGRGEKDGDKKHMTFNQKEKRKRALGASGGNNFVEVRWLRGAFGGWRH